MASPTPDALKNAVMVNTDFRHVLFTDASRTQQVAMAIGYDVDEANCSIGLERHANTTQIFVVMECLGPCTAVTSGINSDELKRTHVDVGSTWIVTPGMWHDVEGRAKLLVVYTPPHYAANTVHRSRADAVIAAFDRTHLHE